MKADANTEAAVRDAMAKFLANYRKRDIDGLMSLIASDDDLFLYGTNIDEIRRGPQEFKQQALRDWTQTEELDFDLDLHTISSAGPVAWVAADGLGHGRVAGQDLQFPLRMTAVFEQRDGQWLLVQSHISVPSAGQEEGSSVPA